MAGNSVTLESSIALRVRALVCRLHPKGPRPLYEFCCEMIAGSSDPLGRLEKYAAINDDMLDRFDGRDLPPNLHLVKR